MRSMPDNKRGDLQLSELAMDYVNWAIKQNLQKIHLFHPHFSKSRATRDFNNLIENMYQRYKREGKFFPELIYLNEEQTKDYIKQKQ